MSKVATAIIEIIRNIRIIVIKILALGMVYALEHLFIIEKAMEERKNDTRKYNNMRRLSGSSKENR